MTEISHRATRPASSPAAVLERTPEDAGKALTQRLMRPKLLAVLARRQRSIETRFGTVRCSFLPLPLKLPIKTRRRRSCSRLLREDHFPGSEEGNRVHRLPVRCWRGPGWDVTWRRPWQQRPSRVRESAPAPDPRRKFGQGLIPRLSVSFPVSDSHCGEFPTRLDAV